MVSLIDEALADEKAFREKTARLLASASCYASADNVRRGRRPLRSAVIVLSKRVRATNGSRIVIDALSHIQALDAALWAKEQLGR